MVQSVASHDIKLENVLLMEPYSPDNTRPICKLSDFGLSINSGSSHDGIVGTPLYMAPEVVARRRGEGYDAKVTNYATHHEVQLSLCSQLHAQHAMTNTCKSPWPQPVLCSSSWEPDTELLCSAATATLLHAFDRRAHARSAR